MSKSISVEGRTLYSAMKIVTAIVERRNTIPILSNVRLKNDGCRLYLSGTDMDIVFETSVDLYEAGEEFDTYPRDERRDFGLAGDAGVDLILKQALCGEILPKGADSAVGPGSVQPHQLPEGGDKRRAEKAAQRFLAGDRQSQLAAGVTHRV